MRRGTRKIMRFAGVVCVPVVCLAAAACAPGKPIHYYALNRPVVADTVAKSDGPVLLVGRIETPETLEDGRIRYRAGSNEVGSYEYHRWNERPAAMVQQLLVETLRASGKYRHVQLVAPSVPGDFLIRGRLRDFSEVDDPGIRTRVSLQLELIDRKTGLVVWDRNFNRDEGVGGKAMKDVVASLDRNLQQVIAEAASGIGSFLSK